MAAGARTTDRGTSGAGHPPLRIGVLGAARIAPGALIAPARERTDVEVTAVAARDTAVADRFAAEHGIARVLPDYEAVVSDPDVDVVYNPLPAGLHGCWTTAALEAGKHVLCEKPFTANADEAAEVAAVAESTGLVLMEAFHYRYHALTERMLEVVRSGRIGQLRRVDAFFRARLGPASDIRWQPGLGPGSLMDIGTYPLHLMRTLAGEEPEVVSAEALTRSPGVDRTLLARLRFPSGVEGHLSSAMLARHGRGDGAEIIGTHGRMTVRGYVGPQGGSHLVVRSRHRGQERVQRASFTRHPTSYAAQLAAFVDAVQHGAEVPTGPADAVAQMRAIDACYRAAGLAPRERTP
ncbi:Gfo/Idh/MocA family oxidoreductase [Nocardioides sp. HDW12B]|uniref:Gfo/Idh/MocA family protein n=1 Tax=Nocardioides sp. HDW12B TaxID=2714939 RepID=UPI00140B9647|nr:Gfo/Idh/MocA family oxidoreductase [Nocardioides sp. HDW12B]QIK65059.1 Gfo/Idh/MocA family oxidoreductase [Nocardioides sp. HDW12B]